MEEYGSLKTENLKSAISTLLWEIEGKSSERYGLKETPNRVAKAYQEWFSGYSVDIDKLFKCFPGEGTSQIVCMKNIPFVSFCEHHMAPFVGTVDVAYLPNGKVIGASKIPRLVNAYSHRLQIQERLAQQIADTLMEKLRPRGVAVIIRATHSCITSRGVKAHGVEMVNSIMLGVFRDEQASRMEALSLLGLHQ